MTDRIWRTAARTAAGVIIAALAGSHAHAQGCMATRVSPPMFGASGEGRYLQAGQWESSLVARSYSAHRHFFNNNEELHETAPKVQRSIIDLSVTRMLSSRFSLTLSVPYSKGTFDRTPMLDRAPVFAGAIDKASGVGDVALVLRRWMFAPAATGKGNLRLGFGVKAPTGSYQRETDRTFAGSPRPGEADVSVQPGDGGWGMVLGLEGFRHLGGHAALFGEGAYILNPRGANAHNNQLLGPGPYVPNDRTSVPDYYLARAGVTLTEPLGWKRASAQVGLRLEGQPVRDIIGSNDGFRRPGSTLAVEPGLSYSFGRSAVYASVPLTIYRRRPLSIDEEGRAAQNAINSPGTRTDAVSAAFADVNVIVGFSIRLN